MEECEPERALHRRRAEVALHASENRREPDELPIRMQRQELGDQGIAALGRREPLAEPLADGRGTDVLRGPGAGK